VMLFSYLVFFFICSLLFRELYMGRLHRMDYDDPVAVDKAKNMQWVTIYRLCGELAVSRSIGDMDYKGFTKDQIVDAFFLWPDNHSKIFKEDLVIPEPEFKTRSLNKDDEFLVLASDGLWDVVSPSEAVKHIR
jgi:serine/threonine protein phosphatase PrpC